MGKTSIPDKVQIALWAKAGGRCEYRGCNVDLIGDLVASREDGKFGFVAHIVADSSEGPRGDPIRSPLLARSIDNLMLMCAKHHKAIDVDFLADHSESDLLEMKAEHEDRIAIVTGMDRDRASHVVRFAADIGKLDALVSTRSIFSAMPPDHHPASGRTIDIALAGSSLADHEPEYWQMQSENLRRAFDRKIKQPIEQREIEQISLFALAPQPLLIQLGSLLGDIVPVRVHQRHREPASWRWQPDQPTVSFEVNEPFSPRKNGPMALKLSVSATINDERIKSLLGDDINIWTLGARDPHNDIMRRPDDLSNFRRIARQLLDRIKAAHGEDTVVHVFPALPASCAVEFGRIRMPKADLAWKLYDQNAQAGGFIEALMVR